MHSTDLYRELVDRLSCGVVVVGPDRRIEVWNDWMTHASGIPATAAVGAPFDRIFAQMRSDRCTWAVRAALTGGRSSILSCALHDRPLLTSSKAPAHSVTIHAIAGPEPRAMVTVRDTSAEVEFSSRLEASSARNQAQQAALRREKDRFTHVTHFDPVTGLANRQKVRNYLAGALVRCLAEDRMGALLLLDVDRFADVNSSVGPKAADQVLRSVAARLADTIRPSDTVARLGGDEFVVVLDGIEDVDDAQAAGYRLLHAFEQPFVVGGHELFLTASIGVTVFPMDDCTADRLLTNAETAVGRAKKQGGAGFQMYSGQMDAEVAERFAMHSALRRAVDNQDFTLVYQPQVNFPANTLVGVEALIRWTHPDRGPVSPGEFIPLLEESGLITQVGAWVLHESCRQAVDWRAAGLPCFRVSVNVSARQFRGSVLQDAVARALSETGFPAEDLELELTESLLMKDIDSSRRILAELKHMGVRVAIDDFGTGYSSLAYLRRFPVDTLKIDRDFTKNITVSGDDLAICRTIVTLGKTLEMEVLAEGVETPEQLELLCDTGCDLFQGFYFGRPMTERSLAEWIDQRREPVIADDLLTKLLSASAGKPVATPVSAQEQNASTDLGREYQARRPD